MDPLHCSFQRDSIPERCSLTEVLVTLRCHCHSARQTRDPWDQDAQPRENRASIKSQAITHKDTICVCTTTCESHLPGCQNPYPPKHASNKPTQEPSPVLILWRSFNFLDPIKKPVWGAPTFNPKSLGASPALCCRCEHPHSIHNDTQLLGTCHERPLKCHLWQPCSSRSFPTLTGGTPQVLNRG